jgi:hypothetical protein
MREYQKPPGGTRTVPLHLLRGVAGGIEHLLAKTGERFVPFLDDGWSFGPGGHLDLFQRFSDQAGESIGLCEALLTIAPGVGVAVYFVPLAKLPAFAAFLASVAVQLPDGRMVSPTLTPPAKGLPADHPSVQAGLNGCHVIGALVEGARKRPASRPGRRSTRAPRRRGQR